MKKYKIAVIKGDGVGPEVIAEGIKVLKAVEEVSKLKFEFTEAPAGGSVYKKTGVALPEKTIEICKKSDAIYKGPVGLPDITPGIIERGVVLTLRQEFDQYINLRPVKLYNSLRDVSPLKEKQIGNGMDIIIVRENSEGLYSKHGGISKEIATDINLFTKKGVDRIIEYAFKLAEKLKKKRVTSVDKANILSCSLFWRKRFEDISKKYRGIAAESCYVDAMTQYLIRCPYNYDIIVTDNMFGDIITDEAAEIVGSLGMGPGANINPAGVSMFEPIHGSAPDIAGKGISNPIGAILSAKLMLQEAFNDMKSAGLIGNAIEEVLGEGYRTKDIADKGKVCSTKEIGTLIADKVKELGNIKR